MSRNTQEPTVTIDDGPMGGEVHNHPAFGQIRASRIAGGQRSLYGSDFVHHNYIELTITKSTLRRSLSNDWPYSHGELIQVAMSEAQWATFVSSISAGMGTQCTINHVKGERMPLLPKPDPRKEQFAKEMAETMIQSRAEIRQAAELLKGSGLSAKKQAEILSLLGRAERDIGSSIGFVAEQFGEHMETVTEKAKIEINAYATNLIARAGLAALQGANDQPLMLGDAKE